MKQGTASGVSPRFSWFANDIEAKFGVYGGRFTRVNSILWLLVAGAATVVTYVVMWNVRDDYVVPKFVERGWTPVAVVLLTYWSLLMLFVKSLKTRLQSRALTFTDLVPVDSDFVLSPGTVVDVLGKLRQESDDPARFILFNRIELALSNLKNMGRIGDVDDVLQSQASNDEDAMDSSFALLRGLIWAIPVLGFIGTVQGLSTAIGRFGSALSEAADVNELTGQLQGVTGGLAVAFDTTLVALIAALIVQLMITLVRKSEEELLDSCREFCQRYIVGKLRLTPFEGV